jgi:hypothetical protein
MNSLLTPIGTKRTKSVASGVSPDVEGGVPPSGKTHSQFRGLTVPGKMPSSTAGETPAAAALDRLPPLELRSRWRGRQRVPKLQCPI